MIDKNSFIAGGITGMIIGVLIGLLLAYILVIYGINAIGDSFTITNMNITVAINETAIIEAQKAMAGIP